MTTPKSAAGIIIKPRPIKPSPDREEDVFCRLRKLMNECGDNRHDMADVLIMACITEGIDTLPRLRAVMGTLGFNSQHFGIRISTGTGADPRRHRWNVGPDGRYFLLE